MASLIRQVPSSLKSVTQLLAQINLKKWQYKSNPRVKMLKFGDITYDTSFIHVPLELL